MCFNFREFNIGKRNSVKRMSFFFEFVIGKNFLFDTPLFAQKFGDVVSDAILEDTDDSLCFVIFPSFLFDKFFGCPEN